MQLAMLLMLLNLAAEQVHYFPSIVYGQILLGSLSSRYETTFTLTAKKEGRATLTLFTDKSEPMKANFLDERGHVASTGTTFEVYLSPNRPIRITLMLTPDEAKEDVLVKTGWATFHVQSEIDVYAVVRITSPDGKLITRHVLSSERPPTGEQ